MTIPAGEAPITTSILSLNDLEIYDEGDYQCIASNDYGSNEKTILQLEVNGKCWDMLFDYEKFDQFSIFIIIALPTVTITPSSVVHGIPSDPTVLTCSGTGKPPPTITFGDLQCNYGDSNGGKIN